jgi:hypothetical protein
MKNLTNQIFAYLFTFLIYGSIILIDIKVIYEGYLAVIHRNIFYKILGVVILVFSISVNGIILVKNKKLNNFFLFIGGYLIVGVIFIIHLLSIIGFFLIPFSNDNLSIDFGILIIKSNFVKGFSFCIDIVLIYLFIKQIKSWATKK